MLQFPDTVYATLSKRFHRQRSHWLCDQGIWPLSINLGLPKEQDAARGTELIRAWITAWENWRGNGEIIWCDRQWRHLGTQWLPSCLLFANPTAVADYIGEGTAWRRAYERYQALSAHWPELARALTQYFMVLANYSATEIAKLRAVLNWLIENPNSNLYPRQLPIVGVDSKWLEEHKTLIDSLLIAILGKSISLRPFPQLLRLRLLDPSLRQHFGGLSDITVPLEELSKLDLSLQQIYIVENLQTGLAFADLKNSVVIMGLGYHVNSLGQLPWLMDAQCLYWGDLDTHGFAILNRARTYLPHLRSILMDEDTLHQHAALWVTEKKQHTAEQLPLLTATEQILYQKLKTNYWGINIRLEQERILWNYAWQKIAFR